MPASWARVDAAPSPPRPDPMMMASQGFSWGWGQPAAVTATAAPPANFIMVSWRCFWNAGSVSDPYGMQLRVFDRSSMHRSPAKHSQHDFENLSHRAIDLAPAVTGAGMVQGSRIAYVDFKLKVELVSQHLAWIGRARSPRSGPATLESMHAVCYSFQ